MGLTLLYGTLVAIPAIIIAGPLYARTLKGIIAEPLKTFQKDPIPEHAYIDPIGVYGGWHCQ
jgi:Gnt-I system high-affinity gluconate transporter